MKRAICLAVCLSLTLALAHPTHAAGKDKGMEPKICKRGKLIFEDDFSGKELEWNVIHGEWRIEKKALMTKTQAKNATEILQIERSFTSTPSIILEFRAVVPTAGLCSARGCSSNVRTAGPAWPSANLNAGGGFIEIAYYTTERNCLASSPFAYKELKWVEVMYEMLGGKYALTVGNKTIKGEAGDIGEAMRDTFQLRVTNPKGEPFLVDDVKICEALPLDAPDAKEEKTAAETKEDKPDEAKTAKADEPKEEKPKEEKPSVELGTTLGKDAAGNPIVWDISAKGAMRSANDKGNLTKVTLYGPGQMSTNTEAKTLVLMGKGDVEIIVEGTSQTVTIPGRAKIEGKPPITLRAKKGTVQITDVKAE